MPTKNSSAMMSLTKRRKLAVSAVLASAAASGLYIAASNFSTTGAAEFDPERDLLAADDPDHRALVTTVDGYDTSQSVTIPSFYDNAANVWDVYVPDDQPFLFYVPRSGANTLGKVFTHCLDFVSASAVAGTLAGGLSPADHLEVNQLSDNGRYVNLDMSQTADITKGVSWNLAPSNLADIITSQHLKASSELFLQSHRGRLITMLRHPVKRAVDNFYYRQRATWDPNFSKTIATMSLLDYAKSSHLVENFLVRTLVDKPGFDVNAADVDVAKNILRRKFLIGIAEEKYFDISVVRFEKYFGWWDDYNVLTDLKVNHCHHDQISKGGHFGSFPKVKSNSEEYNVLASRNWADMELYMYAKGLFKKQAVFA